MSIRGIDLASHQSASFPFGKARSLGFEFCIIKAAGGHTYKNEYLAQQVAGARAADMATAFYFYMFEPSVGGGDVAREAANFIAAVRPHWQPGNSLWLDVEEFPQTVGFTGDLGGWIVQWCDAIEAEFGIVPGIYCATWYLLPTGLANDARLRKYPFWCASWQDTPPGGDFIKPWDKITVWQYDAYFRDVTGADLDCNKFFGTKEEFIALGMPAVESAVSSPAEAIGGALHRADGFMDPIKVEFYDAQEPGAGIPYYMALKAYNPDTGAHYQKEWVEGVYQPWALLDAPDAPPAPPAPEPQPVPPVAPPVVPPPAPPPAPTPDPIPPTQEAAMANWFKLHGGDLTADKNTYARYSGPEGRATVFQNGRQLFGFITPWDGPERAWGPIDVPPQGNIQRISIFPEGTWVAYAMTDIDDQHRAEWGISVAPL